MCGISGYISIAPPAACHNIMAMNAALGHRGPDDEGYCVIENGRLQAYAAERSSDTIKAALPYLDPTQKSTFAMGFSRLAILDLSAAGHQPMLSENGLVAITFNGQIYNHLELKAELQQLGHHISSHSDTEVLLKAYLEWGMDMLPRLNGMFALAISDLRQQKIWLVRDRLGLKPVFYQKKEKTITWASELKAILKTDWGAAGLNMEGLLQNLHLRTCSAPNTCFEGIRALEAAHWLQIDMRHLKSTKHCYWEVPKPNGRITKKEEAIAGLEELLQHSVALRLQADVPVASLMSGGMDSTLVTAMAALQDPSIQCYTLEAAGQTDTELPYAKAMASKIGIGQIVHTVGIGELLDNLYADIAHVEQPYVGPEVVMSATRQLAALGFKVLLSGNGADELFGGYRSSVLVKQWQQRRTLYNFINKLIPQGILPPKYKAALGIATAAQYYAHSQSGMRPYELAALILPKDKPSLSKTLQHNQSQQNPYQDFFEEELRKGIADHHAYRDDLSAMRYGVELRYPFLDHRIVEYVAQLPYEWRYTGLQSKPLLRQIAQKYILPQNLTLPKQGFSFPLLQLWEQQPTLKQMVSDKIDALKKRKIFDTHTITKWQNEAISPRAFYRLWQLFTTEIFFGTYFDR